ncbi:MAG: Tat pathway signal sequence domain protein [Actinomycetia bacterium]|jgi:hypothetical protein|nr:Tat pathway signal sequence domain protein [Actinomycetes bacterium]MDQ1653555.1 hypothetical protein [Cryptosporangiaceae bacterium]
MSREAQHESLVPTGIRRPLTRRRMLGTGVAATVLVATGATGTIAANAAERTVPRGVLPPARRGLAFLDAAMDAYPDKGTVRLAQSYTDQAGLFSSAFTYDNAIAILAYLAAADATADAAATGRATALGDALLYAQAHDPQYTDGRLRQAYNVGPYTFYDGSAQPDGFVKADGSANVGTQFGFTGTATGDMAWAGIALTALYRATRTAKYLDGALKIGTWIVTNTKTAEPLGGWKFGVDGQGAHHPGTATEHNIDLITFFGGLHQATGQSVWNDRRWRAQAFVKKMWEPQGGFFYTGTNDGVTINKALVPEDTQTWSYLALGAQLYASSVDWCATRLKVSDDSTRTNSTVPAGQSYAGVTFTSASLLANEDAPIAQYQPKPDRNGVWFEGTAHLALALRARGRRGDEVAATALLTSIESAQNQLGGDQQLGGKALPAQSGIVSASSPIDTGFGFGYYPYKHAGATAWYLLAKNRANPLRG